MRCFKSFSLNSTRITHTTMNGFILYKIYILALTGKSFKVTPQSYSSIILMSLFIKVPNNLSSTKTNYHQSPQLKPLQNKKGQKIGGTREKSSHFIRKKTAFFSGTPNFLGPSYFEVALGK